MSLWCCCVLMGGLFFGGLTALIDAPQTQPTPPLKHNQTNKQKQQKSRHGGHPAGAQTLCRLLQGVWRDRRDARRRRAAAGRHQGHHPRPLVRALRQVEGRVVSLFDFLEEGLVMLLLLMMMATMMVFEEVWDGRRVAREAACPSVHVCFWGRFLSPGARGYFFVFLLRAAKLHANTNDNKIARARAHAQNNERRV